MIKDEENKDEQEERKGTPDFSVTVRSFNNFDDLDAMDAELLKTPTLSLPMLPAVLAEESKEVRVMANQTERYIWSIRNLFYDSDDPPL